jgi:hypothetical protein
MRFKQRLRAPSPRSAKRGGVRVKKSTACTFYFYALPPFLSILNLNLNTQPPANSNSDTGGENATWAAGLFRFHYFLSQGRLRSL